MPSRVETIDISVVIPVYGSELILPDLTAQLNAVLTATGRTYEIIYVCDQSPDASWRVISELAAVDPSVRGRLLRINAGQHSAVLAGLEVSRGRVIVTMDDDLQHSPADIPALLAAIDGGADVVYARFASRRHPLWKRFGSKVNDLVARRLLHKPADLYLSPFRAFIREIGDEIVASRGPFVYVDGLILSVTRNIATVVVEHHERYAGESRYGLRKSLSLWLKMATGFSVVPLRLTSLLGIATAGLGFLAAFLFVVQKLTIDVMPEGWASLMVAVLIIGGVILTALGVVGEYLGRVLLTVNGRPRFVVAADVGAASATRRERAGS